MVSSATGRYLTIFDSLQSNTASLRCCGSWRMRKRPPPPTQTALIDEGRLTVFSDAGAASAAFPASRGAPGLGGCSAALAPRSNSRPVGDFLNAPSAAADGATGTVGCTDLILGSNTT